MEGAEVDDVPVDEPEVVEPLPGAVPEPLPDPSDEPEPDPEPDPEPESLDEAAGDELLEAARESFR